MSSIVENKEDKEDSGKRNVRWYNGKKRKKMNRTLQGGWEDTKTETRKTMVRGT